MKLSQSPSCSLRAFYRRWFVFGHGAQLLAALLCMLGPVQSQYQPDTNGNPVWNSTDPEPSEGPDYSDADSDALQGWYENFLGTNPYSPDTDSDLITDFDEVFTTGTDPLDTDTDDNGHTDFEDHLASVDPSGDYDNDALLNENDPFPNDYSNYSSVNNIPWYGNVVADDDHDSIPNWNDPEPYPPANDVDSDGIENSLDPFPGDYTNYSSINNTAWYGAALQDNDGDLLLNWQDPMPDDWDQDGDGLLLSEETALGTSDTDVDSDDDGLTDYEEAVVYQNMGVSPTNAHSLSGQYTDWYMVDMTDSDYGGIPDRIEQHYGLNPSDEWDDIHGDLDGDGVSNVSAYQQGWYLGAQYQARYDRDNDGMTDVWELTWGLNIEDPTDAYDDPDGDYVFNVEEYVRNTHPTVADSDSNPANGDDFQFAFSITSASLGLNQTDLGNDGRAYNDDWDADGHDNRTEVLAGSDPRDADSLPVSAGVPSGTPPTVGWSGNQSGANNGGSSAQTPSVMPLLPGIVKEFDFTEYLPPLSQYHDDLRWQARGGLVYHYVNRTRYEGEITEEEAWSSLRSAPDGYGFFGLTWETAQDVSPTRPVLPMGDWVVLSDGVLEQPDLWDHFNYGLESEYYTWWDSSTSSSVEYSMLLGSNGQTPSNVVANWENYSRTSIEQQQVLRLHVAGGANKPITKKFRVARTVFDLYAPPEERVTSISWVGGIQTMTLAMGQESSSQTILLESSGSDLAYGPQRAVRYVPIPVHNSPFTLAATDGAGPRYRKVGLNGTPIPDDKPQVQDESGEIPEETYVDAYSRLLRHSVSDVYVSVESSLMPFAVRRDLTPESYSARSGLRPLERPDRPFGMGWTSNLTPHIRFEDSGTRAVVTDEQGSTVVFVRMLPAMGLESLPRPWIHSRQEKQHGETRFDTLEEVVIGGTTYLQYKKKFGTACMFETSTFSQSFPHDRLTGSDGLNRLDYARLLWVQDRLGNRLVYTYPVSEDDPPRAFKTLIPRTIHDPERPALRMDIIQNDGRITTVRGPSGEFINYNYTLLGEGVNAIPVLQSVTRGGNTVGYGYQVAYETDPTPDPEAPGPVNVTTHLELNRITDERGKNYNFEYILNHSQKFVQWSVGDLITRIQTGLPRLLTSVTMPGGTVVNFSGTRQVGINVEGELIESAVQTTVSGPAGNYTYTFTEPDIFIPLLPDPGDEMSTSRSLTLTFKKMALSSAAGIETFEFNAEAGMALASATDVSGNTTLFNYEDVWEGPAEQVGYFDDPTSQENALQGVKSFTYDAATRVLKSVTDERGTRTEYTIEPVTGLRLQERVIPSGGGSPLRITDYAYADLDYDGFLTKRTVQSNTTAIGDMVTEYEPDDNGRVCNEIVRVAGGMESITSYTYTGNGSKKTVKDPRGYTTTFEYEADTLRLKKVIHPDSTFKELSYDPHGNVLWERNEEGTKTFHEYDDLNRRTKSTVDLNGNGMAGARVTGGGTFSSGTDLVADYNGDLVTETSYNVFNLPVTVKDPRGVMAEHEYDNMGRLTKTTVNSTGITSEKLVSTFSYSGANSGGSIFSVSGFKPTSTTDPQGFVTTVEYDKLYRPVETTMVDTSHTTVQHVTTETEYDEVGNAISVTDPLGRITTTEYDGLNRPTEVHLPFGSGVPASVKQSFYTSAGQVWKSVDELGRTAYSFYDDAGRMIRAEAPVVDDGYGNMVRPVTRTAYDANGNVVAVQDPLGRVIQTEYDNRNRPVEVEMPYIADAMSGTWKQPMTTTEYDVMGRAIKVTDPLGHVTETGYDRLGRATGVKRPAVDVHGLGTLATYSRTKYDAGGNVLETIDARGRSVFNVYDPLGRMTRTTDPLGYQTNFKYDKGGNRTEVKDANNRLTQFVYDAQNRVLSETSVSHPLEGQGGNQTTSFGYDEVNKTSRTDAMGRQTTYAYDMRNRLSTVTYVGGAQGTRTYAYDAVGQLLSVTEGAQPAGNVSYTYDDLGRVSTEVSRGFTHAYSYDLAGNRIATAYGTGRSEARTFDALNRPVGITEGGRTTSYCYDLAGRAVGQLSGNGQWATSHYDAQGRLVRRTLREGTGGGS
ncbi:YD repeat-containing protein, partial [Roseimicrobium gellanilyticum]